MKMSQTIRGRERFKKTIIKLIKKDLMINVLGRIIILNRILYQKLIHFVNPSKIRLDSCCCILYEIQI